MQQNAWEQPVNEARMHASNITCDKLYFVKYYSGPAEQARQTRQLPDQYFRDRGSRFRLQG